MGERLIEKLTKYKNVLNLQRIYPEYMKKQAKNKENSKQKIK